jgi:hypothetical protein
MSKRNISIVLMGMVLVLAAASGPLEAAGVEKAKTGIFIKSVTIRGPSSCTKRNTITVSVTVKANFSLGCKVTLYEDDLLFDDKIGSRSISRTPDESRNWEETVTFTFSPEKFERGSRLEFYAKAGGVKSSVIRVRCK